MKALSSLWWRWQLWQRNKSHWLYIKYWRRYLGWCPLQFCMVCGAAHWAGMPRFSRLSLGWMPWWKEYCSVECCDEIIPF